MKFKVFVMKVNIGILIVLGVFSSHAAFAQSAVPLTRAQVREELMRLEAVGYNPSQGDDGAYPADIQAAQAKVAAQDQQRMAASAAAAGSSGPDASVPIGK